MEIAVWLFEFNCIFYTERLIEKKNINLDIDLTPHNRISEACHAPLNVISQQWNITYPAFINTDAIVWLP